MEQPIRFDPDTTTLYIGDVALTDPDVIAEASRWSTGARGEPVPFDDLAEADLSDFLAEAVSVGARVLAIAAQTSDTLAVQQAVRAASDQVGDVVARAAESAEETTRRATETLTQAARDVADTLTGQVARLLGGESPELIDRLRPVLDKVGTDLESQVAAGVAKAHEMLHLDTMRRHGELADLIRGVETQIAVRAAEEAAAAAVRSVTTVKGFDYEDQVVSAFTEIAAGLGDDFVATGDKAGRLPRNKKGDGVLTVGDSAARIVIEAHDGSSKEWGSYLAEAERNRGAVASIGCVKYAADNGGHAVRVIGQRRVIIAYDPDVDDIELLRTVTLLMRTVALTTSGRFGTEEVATASEAVKEALASLAELDDAKRSANAINGHVTKIEQSITKVTASVQRDLNAALNALTGVALADKDPAA